VGIPFTRHVEKSFMKNSILIEKTPSSALVASTNGIVLFSPGTGPSASPMRVGRKGRALLGLSSAGAPVPPGFILSTEHCRQFLKSKPGPPEPLRADLQAGLAWLGEQTGSVFGDPAHPLLVTLRSSPPEEMPGSLGCVMNLGLTLESVPALARHLGDARAAWDAYRRLLQSYALQVLRIGAEQLDRQLADALEAEKAESDSDLSAAAMEKLARDQQALCEREAGSLFPGHPAEMLERAIQAAFAAWNDSGAEEHREENSQQHLPGTAVVIQATVFGTKPSESGAGHCYTRVPASGEKKLYGKFMTSAQGGDLTAGLRMADGLETLQKRMPEVHAKLEGWAGTLEKHFRDAQEIEFTVDAGELFILRSRPSSRTAKASLMIATDLVDDKVCTQQQALLLVNPLVVDEYLHPVLDKSHAKTVLTQGLGASPGSAVGQVVFFAEHAVELAAQGIKTILVRHETSPEDIDGLKVSEGILTAHGGLTSHAAVVGRGMGKCCVVGAGEIKINYLLNEMTAGETTVKRLDWISLDGTTGEVFLGQLPQIQPTIEGRMARVLEWADAARTLGVHANADTPEDARRAVELGAEGIGLCRTEHMFFDINRIPVFRKMILAVDENGRSAALSDLLPLQRKDFMEIFRVMQGRPVTIRLLDPPLNEFLPKGIRSQSRMAKAMKIPVEVIQQRTEALSENNPMMGHRGCRLAVTYPEIYNMQVRAIVEAACIVKKEGTPVHPEIMVPLVTTARELHQLRTPIVELIERVTAELGESIDIKVGTMIETPRAAVCSASIARHADFYSFGTNDLTQMGFGFSRDDAGMFLPTYLEKGILEEDPFMMLDQAGIGAMVRMAVEAGRKANANLKFGICGEHGGEPRSVKFFHRTGLDYVSCSPFRIPVARLAAGQAALEEEEANV
jgi:pyruvate,orthophosphate dikinase